MEQKAIQDDLLIACLLGEASPEEVKQVEALRESDEAYNKRFEEFRLLWETSKRLDVPEDDAQAALARFRQKAAERRESSALVTNIRPVRLWLSIAASLLLVAGAACLYVTQFQVKEINLMTQAETRTTNLPDGSVITLNHETSLEYPSAFRENTRPVKLMTGEAFFNVVHDPKKPFIISAGPTQIQVMGTSFNVKHRNGSIEVIVETGMVAVKKDGHIVMLKAGEKVRTEDQSSVWQKEPNTDRLYTYYRSKEFEAQDTPLWRVVEVLNEAYDSHIIIERKELRDLPLNTTFKDGSLDEILEVIRRTFKLSVVKKHGTIILR